MEEVEGWEGDGLDGLRLGVFVGESEGDDVWPRGGGGGGRRCGHDGMM